MSRKCLPFVIEKCDIVEKHNIIFGTYLETPHGNELFYGSPDGQCQINDIHSFFRQYIKDFYNETLTESYNWIPDERLLTILYSVTVSIFAIGGMTGALLVGKLVTKFGR